MRGKVAGNEHRKAAVRITPAYAGKRYSRVSQSIPSWDHPRLCGEKDTAESKESRKKGSPPPMRGKAIDTTPFTAISGITPAYAGKSLPRFHRPQWIWDHPRLCGEKGTLGIFIPGNLGSPPPMRGKAIALCSSPRGHRITPAYAGKSYISDRYRFPR